MWIIIEVCLSTESFLISCHLMSHTYAFLSIKFTAFTIPLCGVRKLMCWEWGLFSDQVRLIMQKFVIILERIHIFKDPTFGHFQEHELKIFISLVGIIKLVTSIIVKI